MYIVGLTGGIASGKSTVGKEFETLGIDIVDTDILAREIVEPGMPALTEISQRFGADVLLEDGQLNRAKLRTIVFADEQARQALNAITHPRISGLTVQRLSAAQSPYVILMSPLLVEMGQQAMCHRVLVVDVPEDVQLQRIQNRDGSSEPIAKAMIEAQASRQQRLDIADDVLENNQTMTALNQQVLALDQRYRQLAVDYAHSL